VSLTNEDLAPIPADKRTWKTWDYAALWIGMSICIPTYGLASGLLAAGMSWWQAVLTVLLGNVVVLVPMVLNGHAGAKYGIPFPVLARASFGTLGANVPALLRAVVGCGWFGIQTWIGGVALYQTIKAFIPSIGAGPPPEPGFMPPAGQFVCFMVFWLVNMGIVWAGIESIRKLLRFKSVFLPAATLALLVWAIAAANAKGAGLGDLLARPSKFATTADFLKVFFPALTGMVGFWATLSLNIPDFTRYARSQRDQMTGQALGLPTSMTGVALVGVIVTSATVVLYGTEIWDPVAIVDKFESRLVIAASMFAVVLSTLATNIAANIVAPANDFSNLAPEKLGFRGGGYITGVIGILMCPWKLYADPNGYIFTWLIGYSGLLGPIAGIMIVDYFFVRKQSLDVPQLYEPKGKYSYGGGFNPVAIGALVAGILPSIPGFLVQIKVLTPAPGSFVADYLAPAYSYAWFVGFAVSGAIYFFGMQAPAGSLPADLDPKAGAPSPGPLPADLDPKTLGSPPA